MFIEIALESNRNQEVQAVNDYSTNPLNQMTNELLIQGQQHPHRSPASHMMKPPADEMESGHDIEASANRMQPRLSCDSSVLSDQIARRDGEFNPRQIRPGYVIDTTEELHHRSSSGLGEIFNSIQGKLYRQPEAMKTTRQLESQKRVILDKLRNQLISRQNSEKEQRKEQQQQLNDYTSTEVAQFEQSPQRPTKNMFKQHKQNFFSSNTQLSHNKFYQKHFVVHDDQAHRALKRQSLLKQKAIKTSLEDEMKLAERELFPDSMQTQYNRNPFGGNWRLP